MEPDKQRPLTGDTHESERYPRMIVLNMIVAFILTAIILTMVFLDTVRRTKALSEPKPFENFDAPAGTVEGNKILPKKAGQEKAP